MSTKFAELLQERIKHEVDCLASEKAEPISTAYVYTHNYALLVLRAIEKELEIVP